MDARILYTEQKNLVGMQMIMSLADNKTKQLWHRFMPRRKDISPTIGHDLYSLQVYPPGYFETFNPASPFVKWAAMEVTDEVPAPEGMESFVLPAGMYAVFHYKGLPAEGAKVFRFIFSRWLPQSGYLLDDRPHFELLGDKYRNDSPDSEEEIWIPVKEKLS